MKAFLLTFTILGLTALAQGLVDYHLKCTREELHIRWPSYHSNSEYYICQHVGARQLVMSCEPGEVFTFVLQACTRPADFIPPPPIDVLPTSPPESVYNPLHPDYPVQTIHHPAIVEPLLPMLPKPLYPAANNAPPAITPMQPPTNEQPPKLEIPHIKPLHHGSEENEELEKPVVPVAPSHPVVPSHPAVPSHQAAPSHPEKEPLPASKPEASVPVPPTPEPTPPVLQNPIKKQPSIPGKKVPSVPSKKQPLEPPSKTQKPDVPSKKQPPVVSSKKPIPEVSSKKQPPQVSSKKQPPQVSSKKESPKSKQPPTKKQSVPVSKA